MYYNIIPRNTSKSLSLSEDVSFFRAEFERICRNEVKVPGMTIMRDVAIAKTEFVADQKAITKIQDFQFDDVLFSYCAKPEVCITNISE